MSSQGEEPENIDTAGYAIRLHPIAESDIEAEQARYVTLSGAAFADEWRRALLLFLSRLSYMAPFLPPVKEAALFPFPVFITRFQKKRGAPIYRILFTITGDCSHYVTWECGRIDSGRCGPIRKRGIVCSLCTSRCAAKTLYGTTRFT